MTAEEIKIKLGLDSRELDEGTRKAIQQIANMGHESEKTFVKVGNAGKSFKKVLQELSHEAPIAGLALKMAFSPMVGILTAITMGVVAIKNEIKELGEYATKLGNFTSKRIGNDAEAAKVAARANAKDKMRGQDEEAEIDDALEREIAAASPKQRQQILQRLTLEKLRTRRTISGYNDNQAARNTDRLDLEKAKRDLAASEESVQMNKETMAKYAEDHQLALDATNPNLTPSERTGFQMLFMARQAQNGGNTLQHAKTWKNAEINLASAEANRQKQQEVVERLTNKLSDEADAHESQVKKYKKLESATDKLKESIEKGAEATALHAKLIRDQTEKQNAPYTPGLNEMAQYGGPYGWVARESLAARSYAKMAMSFATPGEFASMNQEVIKAQGQFRNDMANASNGPARQQAFRRYDERMQQLLTGRITPEHSLEVIADQIKSLNDKAARGGMKVEVQTTD